MKITYKTKTKDVLPLLMFNPEKMEWLIEQVPEVDYKSVTSMTVAEFADLTEDEAAYIEKHILSEKRALNAFGKLKSLKRQMDELSKYLKLLSVEQTPDEKAAQRGVKSPTFIQNMMIDLVEFFGLSSFDEAEKRTVAEWIMIFQQKAAEAKVQRNLSKIWEQKNKAKRKK